MAVPGIVDHYSTLELFKHDTTANGPERDQFADVPEVIYSSDAPQVAYSTGLQRTYSGVVPEAVSHVSLSDKEVSKAGENSRPTFNGLQRKFWIIFVALALSVLVAIAVGVGVGVSDRPKGSTVLTPSPSTVTSLPPTATSSAVVVPSLPSPLNHAISNGSSFAAVSNAAGTKYVILQDVSGGLRVAVYSQITRLWNTGSSLMIPNTTDARKNTPISATITTSTDGSDEIFLFYIAANNTLAARHYVSATWVPPKGMNFNLTGFITTPSTQALAISTIPSNTTDTPDLFLLFQGPEGNSASAFQGSKNFSGDGLSSSWVWSNITNDLQWSLGHMKGTLCNLTSATFSTSFVNMCSGSGEALQISLYEITNNEVVECSAYYGNRSFIPHVSSSTLGTYNEPPNEQSDFILGVTYTSTNVASKTSPYTLLVNGTVLQVSFHDFPPPTSPFPFVRLASTTPNGSSAFYLYHQINASTFAEDVWDAGLVAWSSSNISIFTD